MRRGGWGARPGGERFACRINSAGVWRLSGREWPPERFQRHGEGLLPASTLVSAAPGPVGESPRTRQGLWKGAQPSAGRGSRSLLKSTALCHGVGVPEAVPLFGTDLRLSLLKIS